MGRISVNYKTELLFRYVDLDGSKEDYSSWVENSVLSETLVSGLSEEEVTSMNSMISEKVSSCLYYLAMRKRVDYGLFCKNTSFGSILDIVDRDAGVGVKRFYFVRFDIITSLLFNKYPNDIVQISTSLNQSEFEIIQNEIFKIGEYFV